MPEISRNESIDEENIRVLKGCTRSIAIYDKLDICFSTITLYFFILLTGNSAGSLVGRGKPREKTECPLILGLRTSFPNEVGSAYTMTSLPFSTRTGVGPI